MDHPRIGVPLRLCCRGPAVRRRQQDARYGGQPLRSSEGRCPGDHDHVPSTKGAHALACSCRSRRNEDDTHMGSSGEFGPHLHRTRCPQWPNREMRSGAIRPRPFTAIGHDDADEPRRCERRRIAPRANWDVRTVVCSNRPSGRPEHPSEDRPHDLPHRTFRRGMRQRKLFCCFHPSEAVIGTKDARNLVRNFRI